MQTITTARAKCDICGHDQVVGTYSDWVCEQCGQEYEYEEGHSIVLTEAQRDCLRKAAAEAAERG